MAKVCARLAPLSANKRPISASLAAFSVIYRGTVVHLVKVHRNALVVVINLLLALVYCALRAALAQVQYLLELLLLL